jgi:hypothetical protein
MTYEQYQTVIGTKPGGIIDALAMSAEDADVPFDPLKADIRIAADI